MADKSRNKTDLNGKKIAALFTDGVEQVEFTEPRKALEQAGATVTIVGLKAGEIKGWNQTDWGDTFQADITVERANPDEFDGLLLPGGVMNPDKLRGNKAAVEFTRRFFQAGKPVASICHGPWLLVEADAVRGRTLTSRPTLQTDIRNAGGQWVDREVVVDQGLVTSRNPDDIPTFNAKMIEEFAEGRHRGQSDAFMETHDSAAVFPG